MCHPGGSPGSARCHAAPGDGFLLHSYKRSHKPAPRQRSLQQVQGRCMATCTFSAQTQCCSVMTEPWDHAHRLCRIRIDLLHRNEASTHLLLQGCTSGSRRHNYRTAAFSSIPRITAHNTSLPGCRGACTTSRCSLLCTIGFLHLTTRAQPV